MSDAEQRVRIAAAFNPENQIFFSTRWRIGMTVKCGRSRGPRAITKKVRADKHLSHTLLRPLFGAGED